MFKYYTLEVVFKTKNRQVGNPVCKSYNTFENERRALNLYFQFIIVYQLIQKETGYGEPVEGNSC